MNKNVNYCKLMNEKSAKDCKWMSEKNVKGTDEKNVKECIWKECKRSQRNYNAVKEWTWQYKTNVKKCKATNEKTAKRCKRKQEKNVKKPLRMEKNVNECMKRMKEGERKIMIVLVVKNSTPKEQITKTKTVNEDWTKE